MPIMSPLMTVMHRAAEKAVKGLLRDFGELENLQVSEKSPNNFVTAADKRAEETIYYALKKDRPDFGFLMEESGEVAGTDPHRRFIIDPIDGTHNFMRGIPNWCISIAFEESGEVTAGLIMDPLRNEFFMAEKGKGAHFNHKRMRVSGCKDLKNADVAFWYVANKHCTADNTRATRSVEAFLRPLIRSTRQIGSTCLELAWVAAGRFDAYFQEDCSPWDYAAGEILVKEAGGVFTDWHGKKENAIYGRHVIAANADIHRELLSIAQKGMK